MVTWSSGISDRDRDIKRGSILCCVLTWKNIGARLPDALWTRLQSFAIILGVQVELMFRNRSLTKLLLTVPFLRRAL